MVLWVQEDASGFDPYFYFTLMRWRRFHPLLYTPASDEDPLDAAYRKQLPANGDSVRNKCVDTPDPPNRDLEFSVVSWNVDGCAFEQWNNVIQNIDADLV